MAISEQTAQELINAIDRLDRTLVRLMSDSSSDSPLRTIRDLSRALTNHTDVMHNHIARLGSHSEEMSRHGGALLRASVR